MSAPVIHPSSRIHPSAVVDDGATIGENSRIWHFCHVSPGAHIGQECTLGQNVYVGPDVCIGARVKIQNNVSVYSGVTIADEAFIGPSVVFSNVVRPRAFVDQSDAFAPTLVGHGATIGANATIVCGNAIGAYAMVGAGSVVTRDVPAYAEVQGNPARQVGWVDEQGQRVDEQPVARD